MERVMDSALLSVNDMSNVKSEPSSPGLNDHDMEFLIQPKEEPVSNCEVKPTSSGLKKQKLPFVCSTCDKAFPRKVNLTFHMKCHLEKIPLVCIICEKTFSRKYHLLNHMKVHSKTPVIHNCNVCGEVLSQKSDLLKHGKIHNTSKPNQRKSRQSPSHCKCDDCFETFNNRSDLVKHRKIHLSPKELNPSDQLSLGNSSKYEISDITQFSKIFKFFDVFTPAHWNLGEEMIVEVQMNKNYELYVHIQKYEEFEKNGRELTPTNEGITLSCATFDKFESRLDKFNFVSEKDTFVCNNDLLIAYVNKESCILQKLFKSKKFGFCLKSDFLLLTKDQYLKLVKNGFKITKCLIETLLTKLIPVSILENLNKCKCTHLTIEETLNYFLKCFDDELKSSVSRVFDCYRCSIGEPINVKHECDSYNLRRKYNWCSDSALLNFNVTEFVKNIFKKCSCNYTHLFFETMNMDFYNNHLDNVFVN